MDDFLLVLPRKDLYYFDKIDTNRINVRYTYRKINIFKRLIRKIDLILIQRFHIYLKSFNSFVCRMCYDNDILKSIKNNTGVAILDYCVRDDLLLFIKCYSVKNLFFLIWNTLDDVDINRYEKFIDKNNIYSYSYEDSEKYELNHFNDFYLVDYPMIIPTDFDYDMYFMGSDKNRGSILERFINLVNNRYSFKCQLYINKNCFNFPHVNGIEYFSEYMKFDDYIDNVFRSNCLVDFNNHYNITYRTIEAIIFKKKYITNNKKIIHMDIYNPNNILVFDENTSIDEIEQFLSLPLVDIDKKIIEKYDIYYTYDCFKKKVK